MKKIVVLSLLFFTTPSMAIIVNDFNNMCGSDEYDKIYATFEPIEYNCANGYFLPADSLGCVACPSGATCDGGTYAFNETKPQGVVVTAPLTQNQTGLCSEQYDSLIANFEPIEYTCNAGYYLPAGNDWVTDADGCTICPTNNICSGGTFIFNETTDQGIQSCASGTFSPTGSTVCYPHILHVGDSNIYLRSTKQTMPSLNIQIGENIFYANMTTVPTYMNKDSSHYLHILYEGYDYYVCDDTTYTAE